MNPLSCSLDVVLWLSSSTGRAGAPVLLLRSTDPYLRRAVQVKPFIKCCNYNHLMPTRYTLDVDFKSIVTADIVGSTNPTARQSCRKEVRCCPTAQGTLYAIHFCSSCAHPAPFFLPR
jgi:hypothetical protein